MNLRIFILQDTLSICLLAAVVISCSASDQRPTSFTSVPNTHEEPNTQDTIEKKNRSSDDTTPPTPSKDFTKRTESFSVASAGSKEVGRPVHMLWAVDSSVSMREELAAVQKGLNAFVSGLKSASASHVEVTLIGQGISVQPQPSIHIVDSKVRSYDQLPVLASYLSPDYARYGLTASRCHGDSASLIPPKSTLSSHPSPSFFKDKAALKVIVVVSDEGECNCGVNRDVLASECFLKFISEQVDDLSRLRFYGFLNVGLIGLPPARGESFYPSRGNSAYDHLISALGGQKWHISNVPPEQWSNVLKETQESLTQEVLQRVFSLKFPVSKVLKVVLGGKELSKGDYYAAGGKLHITSSRVKKGDVVEVVYESPK